MPSRETQSPRGVSRTLSTSDARQGHPAVPGDTRRATSPTLIVMVIAALVGIAAYAIFLFNPENRGDWLPYTLVAIAEIILISQALTSMWTILAGAQHDPRDFRVNHAHEFLFDAAAVRRDKVQREPWKWPMRLAGRPATVDIFITVYGEDPAVIERTVRAALAVRGAHETWVLDDGDSDEIRDLAGRLGAKYLRRLGSNGAKAGNINHALSASSGDYVAILDADFVPKPEFLHETVPFFTDSRVAFVQSPQVYGNLGTMVARGAAFMQSVFYRFVQPGRNTFNAAFSVGTNVVYRRSALNDIGGMYTDSKSEDVWTSLMLHERGWRSIYIPETLAVGDAPETIEDFTKQQTRWATGGFEILFTHNPLSPRRRLTLDQRVQYLVTATHYLAGIVPLLLLAVPPLEIYFELRPVNLGVTWETWLMFYLGFYLIQILLAFATMGSFRPETLLLSAVSFPIYVRAIRNVIEGREQKWHVTGGQRNLKASPFNFIVPQILTFVFLLVTSFVAIYRDVANGQFTLATAWNVTNTIVLGIFLAAAVAEHRRMRAENRVIRALAKSEKRAEKKGAPASPPERSAQPTREPVGANASTAQQPRAGASGMTGSHSVPAFVAAERATTDTPRPGGDL